MNPLSAVPWHALSNGCMAEVGCNVFVQFLCRSSCVCVPRCALVRVCMCVHLCMKRFWCVPALMYVHLLDSMYGIKGYRHSLQ